MLVLSRKKGETIVIGNEIEITILDVTAESIRIGIDAPKHVEIYRKELLLSIQQSNQESSQSTADLSKMAQEIKKMQKK